MTMPKTPIERLAMNLGLATYLIQSGTPLVMVKQQMVSLISAARDVLNDESIPDHEVVQVIALLPTEVADVLAEDATAPGDLTHLDDGDWGQ